MGVVPVGADGRPLRSCIIWADQRAQAEQAAQAAQAAPAVNQAAQAAKTLSETDVNGDNALARLLAARQGGAI